MTNPHSFPPPPYANQQPQQTQQYAPPPGFQPSQAPAPSAMQTPQPPNNNGFFIPNQEVIQNSYARAQEIKQKIATAMSGAGNFTKLRFMEILGPNGQKWKTAYPGFTGCKAMYIMPSWKEGAMNYVERVKHFWRSQNTPQGGFVNGAGDDSLITKAYRLALDKGVKSPWCRPQKVYVYQGFPYEYNLMNGEVTIDPSQCIHEDGQLKPLLLEASSTVHTAIQDIAQARQFVQMFHPDFGRPILIKKVKTGPDPMNVDYSVLDLNQQPLDQVYRPGLAHLYSLDELFKPGTVEEQIKAIVDAGLPMPPEAGGFQGQAQTGYAPPTLAAPQQQYQQQPPQMYQQPASYQQQPMPPQQNPYQQPQFQPQYQQQAPQGYQQPQQQNWPPPPQPGMAPQQFVPKPLPPLPQGAAGSAGTPMIPQNAMPQQYQPQGKPLTPEDLQAQLQGNGDGSPF